MKTQFPRLVALVLVILTLGATAARGERVWLRADPRVLAMFSKKFAPEYVFELRLGRMEGEGKFRLYVNKEGAVTKIGVMKSTGYEKLDLRAAGALVQWKARPGRSFEADIIVVFTLGFPQK